MNLKHLAYTTWISCEVEGDGYGKCKEVCEAMRQVFPELELRFGFFHAAAPWGRRQHYWLRAPGGQIVDPTARQHPSGVLLPETDAGYEDLADASPEELARKIPTGVCMDCGGEVYGGDTFCNESCEAATASYLGLVKKPNGNWGNA
jgi:hypothetical protein